MSWHARRQMSDLTARLKKGFVGVEINHKNMI